MRDSYRLSVIEQLEFRFLCGRSRCSFWSIYDAICDVRRVFVFLFSNHDRDAFSFFGNHNRNVFFWES